MSMSMLNVPINAAYPCPCCLAISVLHDHIHVAYPCPGCMFMSMLHVKVHAACSSPCFTDIEMQQEHGSVAWTGMDMDKT
jgi:hypothetical protein